MDDLVRQSLQASLRGRRFIIDVVIDAPGRFSSAVREALEAELPSLRPAVLRVRFHLTETAAPAEIIAVRRRIGRRGSHGVILKAPDLPEVAAAVADLLTVIPVDRCASPRDHGAQLPPASPMIRAASEAADARLAIPSLLYVCSRCLSTVRGLRPRMSAMSRVALP